MTNSPNPIEADRDRWQTLALKAADVLPCFCALNSVRKCVRCQINDAQAGNFTFRNTMTTQELIDCLLRADQFTTHSRAIFIKDAADRLQQLDTESTKWRNVAGIMHEAFLDQDEEVLLTAYHEACQPETEVNP
jgi:hypothetical protein